MNTLRTAVFLLVVCVLTSVYLAEVKRACGPNACMTVKCGIPPECRNITAQLPDINKPKKDEVHPQEKPRFRIIPHGGYCGCCDLCQKLLRKSPERHPKNPYFLME